MLFNAFLADAWLKLYQLLFVLLYQSFWTLRGYGQGIWTFCLSFAFNYDSDFDLALTTFSILCCYFDYSLTSAYYFLEFCLLLTRKLKSDCCDVFCMYFYVICDLLSFSFNFLVGFLLSTMFFYKMLAPNPFICLCLSSLHSSTLLLSIEFFLALICFSALLLASVFYLIYTLPCMLT